MKDVVSRHGISVVGWVVTMSIASALSVPQGFPWTILAAVTLTLVAAALLAKDSRWEVVRGVAAQPRLAVVVVEQGGALRARSRLRLK